MKKLAITTTTTLLLITGILSYKYKSNDYDNYTPVSLENLTKNALVNKDYSNYRSWYRITHEKPNTGDIIGILGKSHNGPEGYREVYINSVGEAVNKGTAPYKYPAGTVIVKEQYKNKSKWEEQKSFKVQVMVKLEPGSSPETGDWGYTSQITDGKISSGRSGKARFCGGCHAVAQDTDYVFMNSDLLASEKN